MAHETFPKILLADVDARVRELLAASSTPLQSAEEFNLLRAREIYWRLVQAAKNRCKDFDPKEGNVLLELCVPLCRAWSDVVIDMLNPRPLDRAVADYREGLLTDQEVQRLIELAARGERRRGQP